VPHWFMSPWFPKCSEVQIVSLSQSFTNNCPYAIYRTTEKRIILNPNWLRYISDNYGVLRDFCYWNLTLFLQRRNPNVPDIPHKLIQPLERNSLTQQRKFWNVIFEQTSTLPCVFTGKTLTQGDFDLDHFIPWSFVAHDLLWNLLPVDSSVNSRKSNHLPDLNRYLPPFAETQQRGLRIISELQPNNRLLEDYLQLGAGISDLIQMPSSNFLELYRKAMTPLYQIAENMGFTRWTA